MLKSYWTACLFALWNWKDSSDWFEKKNIRIFGARMFAVYVEASIGICCFITVRPIFVSLFCAQCGKALRLTATAFTCKMYSRHMSALTICIHPIQSASPFSLDRCDWRLAFSKLLSQSRLTVCRSLCELCHMHQPQIVLRVLSEQRVRGHRRAGVCILLKAAACRYCPGFGSEVRNRGVDSGKQ